MNQTVVPIRASTQQFVEITDINNDLVMLADGSCAMVITTTAVNFGLLSEKEQEALIYSYARFLNSLSFPVQILIRTQHKDISAYVKLLEQQEDKQTNPKLKKSIHDYRIFVAATVKEKDVLDKKFYIAIPFSCLELGPSTNVLLGSKHKGLPFPKTYIYERALIVLGPKRDHVVHLLARLGLRAYQMTNEQLTKLFFTIYNPIGSPEEPSINQQTKKD